MSLSQDALAEKIYVSRQTISNWENDKSYPDIRSLVLLSEVFGTSIDNLIKGDIEIMKEKVKNEDTKKFEKLSKVYGVLFLFVIISPIPLAHFLRFAGIGIWIALSIAAFYFAVLMEQKKSNLIFKHIEKLLHLLKGKGWMKLQRQEKRAKGRIRRHCWHSAQVW